MGPIITRDDVKRITGFIDEAEKMGGKVLVDGRGAKVEGCPEGFWLGPTIIDRLTPEIPAAREEIFGPVLSIVRVKTLDEALALQNKSRYGNGASIFTTNGGVARYAVERLTAGMVGVNVGVPVPREPFAFGGWKDTMFGHGDITGMDGFRFWTGRARSPPNGPAARRELDVVGGSHEGSQESQMIRCKRHTIYTWSAGRDVNPLPIARAEGVYMYTTEGQRILDFNSQLMSVLIGHGHPKVIAAMKKQLDELIFVYPQTATARARGSRKLLSEVVPGNINSFFYTLGGAEANENAIRAARLFSGRFKILSRYRSYHGGTNLTLQLTGDPRRWPAEPGSPGIVHVMDPKPYNFSFGETDQEINERYFTYLEEVIQYENPRTSPR